MIPLHEHVGVRHLHVEHEVAEGAGVVAAVALGRAVARGVHVVDGGGLDGGKGRRTGGIANGNQCKLFRNFAWKKLFRTLKYVQQTSKEPSTTKCKLNKV